MHAIKIKLLTLLIAASVVLSMKAGSTLAAFSDYETIQMSFTAGYMGLTKTCELDGDILGKAFNVLNDGSLNGQLELVEIYENGANLFSEENQPNGLFDSSPTFNISVFYNNELNNYKIRLNETLPLTILPDMAVNSAAKIIISDNRIIPLEAKAEEMQPALDVVQPSETSDVTTAAPDTQDIQPTIGHADAAEDPAQPTGAATEDTSESETEQAQTETDTAAPTEDTIEPHTEDETTAYETQPVLSETEAESTEELSAELESEQPQETEQSEQQSEWEEASQPETLPSEPVAESGTEPPATEPATQDETQEEGQIQPTSVDIEEAQETNSEVTSESLTSTEDTTEAPAQALAMESKDKPDKDKPEKPMKPKPTQPQPEWVSFTKTYTFVFKLTRSTFVSNDVVVDFKVIEWRWCIPSTAITETQPQQQVDGDVEENTEDSQPIKETASEPETLYDESTQTS